MLRQHLETYRLLGVESLPMVVRSGDPPRVAAAGATRPRSDTGGLSAEEKRAHLDQLNQEQVTDCRKCHLCEARTKTVFGQGDSNARLVFVGEAPGFDEDQQGLAFVGKAGQLLTKMIEAMGVTRDEVFICNVLKCRPPDNRTPAADEIAACSPYLFEQLRTINPKVIIALGAPASQTLLGTTTSIGKLRGQFHDFFTSGVSGLGEATPLMPTYHPAYLLRSPGEKIKTWEDLQKVMAHLGLQRPTT